MPIDVAERYQKLRNNQQRKTKEIKNRVFINCYTGNKSYVQGKQSVLFQKIISYAIEMMDSNTKVVEVLNHYHVLDIKQEEVELKFEEYLPDYSDIRNGKHYNNLLSAVYNTMLTGYMPDYTALLSPVFRSYEYCLHRILGDKMELNTCDNNGRNVFSFFNKVSAQRYECNSLNLSKLSPTQQKLLNDIYSEYHNVRHSYSHWSADDTDTAVISSIDFARELIIRGLDLINKYYRLF